MLKGKIEKVIFNDPATIVFWKDGTKTVVKAGSKPVDISNDCWNEDKFDPEKGLAMAIAKKALGNEGNYYNEFKKWLPEKNEEPIEFELSGYSDGRKIYSDKKFVIRMDTRKDAEKLIDDAIDIGKVYGYVTLSNLKRLYGRQLCYYYREALYGWTYKIFKSEANIMKNSNGTYDITLPEPMSLTKINIKPESAE